MSEHSQGISDRSSRLRKLTEKGETLYEDKKLEHKTKLSWSHEDILYLSEKVKHYLGDDEQLEELKAQLHESMNTYDLNCREYIEFLSRTNTADSTKELGHVRRDTSSLRHTVEQTLTEIDNQLQQVKMSVKPSAEVHVESVKSASSHRKSFRSSSRLTSTSKIAQTKARVEAARVRAMYTEKEAELLKQKAQAEEQNAVESAKAKRYTDELNAQISVLNSKKEVAAIEAEFHVLSSELDENSRKSEVLTPQPPLSATEKTASYLKLLQTNVAHISEIPQTMLNPHASVFTPTEIKQSVQNTAPPTNPIKVPAEPVDFATLYLKKDILVSRFRVFNDKPEFYPSWKSSFKNIMKDAKALPSEEIDLLLKYTGSQSQKHVQSINAANASNPDRGLKLIWQRLDERYGCPELIDNALKSKLSAFPKLSTKDYKKLYELSDILMEIQSVKCQEQYKVVFSYFDSSNGINPIVGKLPYNLQEKWTRTAVDYNKKHGCLYPTFNVFVEFVNEQSKVRNNPSFVYDGSEITTSKEKSMYAKSKHEVRSKKTELSVSTEKPETTEKSQKVVQPRDMCPLHNAPHSLNKCKTFRSKPLFERRRFLRQHKICFKCCESVDHMQTNCTNSVKCDDCGSATHATAMHVKLKPDDERHGGEQPSYNVSSPESGRHGGEQPINDVSSKCTQTSGNNLSSKSCAKIVLVNAFQENEPDRKLKLYAMIDDQSNRTLARTALFDFFGANTVSEYRLSTCAGNYSTSGRRLSNLTLEAHDGSSTLQLPDILECDQIPEVLEEIPTKAVVVSHPHLRDLEEHIPNLDPDARILLLIGRDVIEAHHVLDQRIGQRNSPYAQKLSLGWTIIGETCLGKVHRPTSLYASVKKTNILKGDRVSIFEPCSNDIYVSETSFGLDSNLDNIGQDVFVRTPEDDKPGLSCDDRHFLKLMNEQFEKDANGNWSAPLPFRHDKPKLPNNKIQALRRAKSLDATLRKNPEKAEHFRAFMESIFENGHAEPALTIANEEEQWFLPIFGIYHPKKPGQLRAVFDSSAKFDGVSLNDVLLTGPDFTNSLLGILLRFRKDAIAIIGDIQQMFYCFKVHPDHRRYLRFLWYEDNNIEKPLKEFMMNVHVFGNSPSPAVATYGLRKTAKNSESKFGVDVKQFVERNFYVDDGLISLPTVSQAVDLLKRTKQALLTEGNIRLHKISSNSEAVMTSFPQEDLAKGLKDLDLTVDSLPTQRSLGMNWDLQTDCFVFKMDMDNKPYTRRGILSTINSIYDPLGLLAPVVIKGKILLRAMMRGSITWDEPLPSEHCEEWNKWRSSLRQLEDLKIPRMFLPVSFSECDKKSVHIFSDASEKAIAAVRYLQAQSSNNQELGFIIGKTKVAPNHSHTIPRLELCAAVLASEIGQLISEQLDIPLEDITYYTDSRVVLGYIHNRSRRFYTYVSNRVAKIHGTSNPQQWIYVSSEQNPADVATRSTSAENLSESTWLTGPSYLLQKDAMRDQDHELQNPEEDKEIRPEIVTLKTFVNGEKLGSHRFERFGSLDKLVRSISLLKNFVRKSEPKVEQVESENFIIREVQEEVFGEDIACIKAGKPLPKASPLASLDPFLDDSNVIRVGGRLKRSCLSKDERNPVIIPGRHWIATLLVRHYHQRVKHQGRHFTSGAVRSAGYWITSQKRLVSSILHKCVVCRKLRRSVEQQKMADLPKDRLEPGPPFTSVGIDTFGPWNIVTRRTRGGVANSKRWAILFTCMTIRAVHIEVVEDMTASSFINAFKRFVAIRGSVTLIRSDRGTNFVGATDALQINAVNVEDGPVQKYLYESGVQWLFNPPHSSHMGGIWERMIKTTRRILDSMISEVPGRELTHDVLVTFLAEACAIINSRPLSCISTDPEEPYPLSPSLLVTQKPDVLIPKDVSFDSKDLYRAQWKRVQHLADVFWRRWKCEFLQVLQSRRKWTDVRDNLQEGDVVLLKDNQENRINWPMGVIVKVFPSDDGIVRKAEVCLVRTNSGSKTVKKVTFVRPITELVLLVSKE